MIRRALHWLFGRGLCFGGLAGALAFFCVSLTPSLLPRGVILQGVLSGVSAVIGYGLGSGVSAALRAVRICEPGARGRRIAWWVLVGSAVVSVPLFLVLGRTWQNTVRDLMGMKPLASWEWLLILVVTLAVAALILVVARLVRGFARGAIRIIDRWVPRVVSATIGVVLTIVIVAGVIQGFVLDPALAALNEAYAVVNKGTEPGVEQPLEPERSGSPTSLVAWDTLGVQGRDFTGLGPRASNISDFTDRPAKEPIRVYVGLESADSLDQRVQLTLDELDRTHAWSRTAIGVFTTTGTGWVDEKAASPLEYEQGGDTALVAMQYSYLPSWISFLVDAQKAADTGRAVISAVHARLDAMPAATRPKLLVFGESLGSYGTEHAFDGLDQMLADVDGALLAGPVFRNPIHNTVTDDREPGSPFWRPVYQQGRNVRFAVRPEDLASPATAWHTPRIVYLQNATDPITYWKFDLLWKHPEWLDDPRGPDVSRDMVWMPFVTFWQTAGDMVFSTGVPPGHGHNYGVNAVDAWAAILPPSAWSPEMTARLRSVIAQ